MVNTQKEKKQKAKSTARMHMWNRLDRLLSEAKEGDDRSKGRFFDEIKKQYLHAVCKRYNGNVLVDDEDIESEFMVGCLHGYESDKGIGSSSAWVVRNGWWAVLKLIQRRVKKGVSGECLTCYSKKIVFRQGRMRCADCFYSPINTWMHEQQPEEKEKDGVVIPSFDVVVKPEESIDYEAVIEEIRAVLTGRPLQLFNELVSIPHQNLGDISRQWGISSQAVSAHKRSVRRRIDEYFDQA